MRGRRPRASRRRAHRASLGLARRAPVGATFRAMRSRPYVVRWSPRSRSADASLVGSASALTAERSRCDTSGVRGAEPPRRVGDDHRRAGDRHRDRRLGCRPAHPDLAGAVLQGYDFVDDDTDPSPADGHGTGVAGTAAARANNGIGGVGACFTCSLMPLQVVGPGGIALNLDIAEAIDYAVDHGAAVVNVSLIGPNSPPELERAIGRARAAGVFVVAAAGNDGDGHAPVPGSDPRDDLGRSFDVRRKAGELLQPRHRG